MLKQLLRIKKQRQKGLKDKVLSLKKAKFELSERINAMRLQRSENIHMWKELSEINREISHADFLLLQEKLCACYDYEQKIKMEILEKSNELSNYDQSVYVAQQAVQRNLVEQEKLRYLMSEVH